jgi:hypothetical protein
LFAFFEFSLEPPGSFELAHVAVAIFLGFRGVIMQLQRLSFLEVRELELVRLLHERGVFVPLLSLAQSEFFILTPLPRVASSSTGRKEEILHSVDDTGDAGRGLFLLVPQARLSLGALEHIERIRSRAGVGIKRLAQFLRFLGVGLDEVAAFLA